MIKGWTGALPSADTVSPSDNSFVGSIISEKASGGKSRVIVVKRVVERAEAASASANASVEPVSEIVRVGVDADKHPEISKWLTLRGARKLLAAGVVIEIQTAPELTTKRIRDSEGSAPKTDGNDVDLWAISLRIVGALPATPYLARLLSMPSKVLDQLFEPTASKSADRVNLEAAKVSAAHALR